MLHLVLPFPGAPVTYIMGLGYIYIYIHIGLYIYTYIYIYILSSVTYHFGKRSPGVSNLFAIVGVFESPYIPKWILRFSRLLNRVLVALPRRYQDCPKGS